MYEFYTVNNVNLIQLSHVLFLFLMTNIIGFETHSGHPQPLKMHQEGFFKHQLTPAIITAIL
jgi:hypothetical protein